MEFSVLARVCLKKLDSDADALQRNIGTCEAECNEAGTTINWRFTTQGARAKMRRFEPILADRSRDGDLHPGGQHPAVFRTDGAVGRAVRCDRQHDGHRAITVRRYRDLPADVARRGQSAGLGYRAARRR